MGEQMHSHDYRDERPFAGKRVVVVGGGNSGVDIACASSYVSERTILSLRRGIHVIRKRLGGKPVDQQLAPAWLPWAIKQKGFELLRRRSGDVSDHGLPVPDHKIGHAHPTVSEEVYDRLADGSVVPKPNIKELRGDSVIFTDGTTEQADVVVYCTGYRISFPFFHERFISAPDNDLPLYRRVFHPESPGLYFIGLAQPLGAIMPLAEAQAKWLVELLRGEYALPPRTEMLREIAADRRAHAKRFYKSARHTMEVDFDEYVTGIDKERQVGRERIAAGARPELERRAAKPAPA